jgi:hypothetical protein
MNAVIIYDDAALAAKANAMLHHAAQRAWEGLQVHVRPWRMEMLNLPIAAGVALTEAIDAHLILFSLRPPWLLPVWLQTWLEQWAARRQVQDAALAIWGGRLRGSLSAEVPPEIVKFAAHHGLNCVIGDEGATEGESRVFAHCPQANSERVVHRSDV